MNATQGAMRGLEIKWVIFDTRDHIHTNIRGKEGGIYNSRTMTNQAKRIKNLQSIPQEPAQREREREEENCSSSFSLSRAR